MTLHCLTQLHFVVGFAFFFIIATSCLLFVEQDKILMSLYGVHHDEPIHPLWKNRNKQNNSEKLAAYYTG